LSADRLDSRFDALVSASRGLVKIRCRSPETAATVPETGKRPCFVEWRPHPFTNATGLGPSNNNDLYQILKTFILFKGVVWVEHGKKDIEAGLP
jgi:hypothetical protein